MVFVHELLTVLCLEFRSETPHCLRNEKRAFLFFLCVKRGRMELVELKIGYRRAGAVGHGQPVARGDRRVRCVQVNLPRAARSKYSRSGQYLAYPVPLHFVCVNAVACNPVKSGGRRVCLLMLGQKIDAHRIFQYRDIFILFNIFREHSNQFSSGNILEMKHSALGMTSLAVKRIFSILLILCKIHAPSDEIMYYLGTFIYDHTYGFRIAELVTGGHSIPYVLLE